MTLPEIKTLGTFDASSEPLAASSAGRSPPQRAAERNPPTLGCCIAGAPLCRLSLVPLTCAPAPCLPLPPRCAQSSCTPRSPASSRLWCRVSALAFGWVWGCLCGWVLAEVVQCLHISGLRAQTHVLPLQPPPCCRGHLCVSTAFTAPRRQRLAAHIVWPRLPPRPHCFQLPFAFIPHFCCPAVPTPLHM